MRTRTTVMTISKIEADLLDVSTGAGPAFVPGFIWVEATDGREFHRWQLPADRRCFIGDRIEVVIVDEDPILFRSDHLEPPPIAKPFTLATGDTLRDESVARDWRYDGKQWVEQS